ncbi:MAG: TlpA family protein disulfide reductase [Clostridiales bacterium]|nr:TlpA family protein disulfide reductase [Clostridiales bacterium]
MKKKNILSIAILIVVFVLVFSACTPAEKKAIEKIIEPTQKADETKYDTKDDMKNDTKDDTINSEETMEFMGDAFNFELMDLDGNTHKVSDYTGKKVYVKFWASWCSICLAGMSEFSELDQAYADDEDVVILTMVAPKSSGEMPSDKFEEWFRGQGLDFAVLLDEGGSAMREYGIRGFPTSVFIDSNGDIFEAKVGHVSNDVVNDVLSQMQ